MDFIFLFRQRNVMFREMRRFKQLLPQETAIEILSGVTNWGFYVELPNTVEGLVRISELRDDYYIFDESRYELVGEMSRKVYKLGQPVRVVVAGTDKLLRTVDFVLENQMV